MYLQDWDASIVAQCLCSLNSKNELMSIVCKRWRYCERIMKYGVWKHLAHLGYKESSVQTGYSPHHSVKSFPLLPKPFPQSRCKGITFFGCFFNFQTAVCYAILLCSLSSCVRPLVWQVLRFPYFMLIHTVNMCLHHFYQRYGLRNYLHWFFSIFPKYYVSLHPSPSINQLSLLPMY